jgi:hypothetical protein
MAVAQASAVGVDGERTAGRDAAALDERPALALGQKPRSSRNRIVQIVKAS